MSLWWLEYRWCGAKMLEMEVYHKRLDSNLVRLGQVEIQGFGNISAYVPWVIKKNICILLVYGSKKITLHIWNWSLIWNWHQWHLKALPHTFTVTFSKINLTLRALLKKFLKNNIPFIYLPLIQHLQRWFWWWRFTDVTKHCHCLGIAMLLGSMVLNLFIQMSFF